MAVTPTMYGATRSVLLHHDTWKSFRTTGKASAKGQGLS